MRILRYFHTHRAFFWAIVNQFALSGGAFFVVLVLSRFLGYEAFGGIRFLAATLAISAFFSLPGISYVLMQGGERLTSRDALRMLKAQVRWGSGAVAIGIAFFFYYLRAGNTDLAYGFLISSFFAPFANLYLMPGFILAAQKRFKAKALVDGITMAAIVVGAGYGAWATRTIAGTALYYFGVQTVATMCMLWFAMRSLPASAPARPDATRDIRYGTQLTLFQLPFTLLPSLEKVLVFFLLGPANLAFFIIAVLPVEHAKNALRSLFQFYIFPHMERRHARDAFARWVRLAVALVAFAMLVTILFIVVAFPFFFPHYTSVFPFVLALMIALVPLPAQVLTLSWIASKSVDRLRAFAYAITVADLALFVALGAWGGLAGVVAAKIAMEFFSAALIVLLHVSREGWREESGRDG